MLYAPEQVEYGVASTYANMTFGQNMQVTMIQVAAAIASIVNGEIITRRRWWREDGRREFVKNEEPKPVRQDSVETNERDDARDALWDAEGVAEQRDG